MSTIEKSIEVNVPEYTAYAQWTRFEEFPQFMEGVKEVERNGKRLHWKAEISGQDKEWDAEITEETADQRIAWRSRDGAIIRWVVTFHQLISNARSKVMVQLEYDPQGLTEITGEALGVVSSNVQGDLERFKVLIEKRWQPAGRETIFDIAVGKTY